MSGCCLWIWGVIYVWWWCVMGCRMRRLISGGLWSGRGYLGMGLFMMGYELWGVTCDLSDLWWTMISDWMTYEWIDLGWVVICDGDDLWRELLGIDGGLGGIWPVAGFAYDWWWFRKGVWRTNCVAYDWWWFVRGILWELIGLCQMVIHEGMTCDGGDLWLMVIYEGTCC